MKLQFIRFIEDRSGGPHMPTVVFKHADMNGELHITNSFYGASACLNPGPNHVSFRNMTDLNLSKEDVRYMWNCFKTKGK